jgi:radical SAM superfamily enzyme YgiQ (UPF0313 family)
MNVLIIATNRNAYPMPVMPVGACMVAEAAELAGHSVRVLDLMFERDPVAAVRREVRGHRPGVVGLSVRNIDNNDMRMPAFYVDDLVPIVRAVREETSARLVLGGAALTVMPDEIMKVVGADAAVLGDGEVVFPSLLARIAADAAIADLPGIAYRENGTIMKNACVQSGFSDDFLAPDYRRWLDVSAYRSQMATVPVQTKLGCSFQCVYCTYRKIEGSSYRFSDPGKVADAVAALARAGLRDVEFVDSVFNAPYDHAMKVCDALARKRHGARLQSLELNPAQFDDGLVTAMERAGFTGMGMTVESASDRVLTGLRKGFTAGHVHRAAEIAGRHRLPCVWIFLLGGPGETRDTVRETLRFAETRVPGRDVVFFNIGIRIYPGTEIESIARSQGLLTKPADEMLPPVFYVSPEVDADWMLTEVRRSMSRHMHFINTDSIGFRHLPLIHRALHRLGVRPPLWRYTRYIRRGLRMMGMDV